ncbi:MAG: 16S rRNA (guanine(966)-N(2))-methyltransferase RsmD [Patescibacteria group bacterium]
MRVISGELGGREFTAPTGHRTHPMADKVRGALFNMLGDVSGLTVLDPFAGSGALSFEAISRGASSAIAIELDKGAQKLIQGNIQLLHLSGQVTLVSGNCLRWSSRFSKQLFDLVLCDPPYDRLLIRDIQKLSVHVKAGGLLVMSWPGHLKAEELVGFEQIKVKSYGDAQLVFYRRIS